MDYVRFNYALRPQDKVDLETDGYVSANMISGLLNGVTAYFRVRMLLKEKRTGTVGIRKTERSFIAFLRWDGCTGTGGRLR